MADDRVRYICPICDQELKFGTHFCWNCKSRVREPWKYTGGHLPNEGHDGCHSPRTYLKPRSSNMSAAPSGTKSLAGKNNAGKQYTYNRPGQSGTAAGYGGANRSQTPRGAASGSGKNAGCGGLVVAGVLFYFLVQFLIAFLR